MPAYSALALAPYPPNDSFTPTVTLQSAAPEYGYHFHPLSATSGQCVLDDCAYYPSLHGLNAVPSQTDPIHLLQHYELLYRHESGHLFSKYYIVPWIALEDNAATARTIDLSVSPYSIYDEDKVTKNKKFIKKRIDDNNSSSARNISLSCTTSTGITAYWKTSGNATTIGEVDLKSGEHVRLVVAPGQYVGNNQIEAKHAVEVRCDTSSTVGKINITLLKTLRQPVCFLEVKKSATLNKYEAKFLEPADIPKSFDEPSNTIGQSIVNAFKPYGIDVAPVGNVKCMDKDNVVLSSTTQAFLFDDLAQIVKSAVPKKPGGEFSARSGALDNEICSKFLSKIARYTYTDGTNPRTDDYHRACVVILLPWDLYSVGDATFKGKPKEEGYSRPVTPIQGELPFPLHCYIFPYIQELWRYCDNNKTTLWTQTSLTVPPVSKKYVAATVVHEIGHSLLLRHTFVEDLEERETIVSVFDKHETEMTTLRLSKFGEWLDDPNQAAKLRLYNLLRNTDLRDAMVNQYLVNKRGYTASDLLPPWITGLNNAAKLGRNVFFDRYATDNVMDYAKHDTATTPRSLISGGYEVDLTWEGIARRLYRYQWELVRATVQYLSRSA